MKNKHIQEIKDGKKVIAMFISGKLRADGVKFLTPLNYPLQIGLLQHKKGKIVPPHYHPHLPYKVTNTQEFLYVVKGSMEVTIYTKNWKKKAKKKLRTGDAALFVDCGHSVIFSKNSRVIEIKQGPYPGDKKAKVFRDK